MKAVVLHSGGLDSTTLISHAIFEGATEILALSIRYGSLHNTAEGEAAERVIEWYRENNPEVVFTRLSFTLPAGIFQGEKSALMGEIDMPNMTYHEITQSEGPSPTVVPFRNANLISIATAVADARGYELVYIGAHGEDAHNWAYPDCTPEFLGAMANAIHVGTYGKVRLRFPFIWDVKSDIVSRAALMDVPLHLTWSCYAPYKLAGQEYIHCGQCPTCIERANAFANAGFLDPTAYNQDLTSILDPDIDMGELEEWGD